MIGGALAGIPTVLFAFTHSFTAGVVTLVVFLVYTQTENHILNPVIMSKTVKINPLLVLIAVLVGASLGSLVGGLFGGFVAALLAIPLAGALQVLVREASQATPPPHLPPPQLHPVADEFPARQLRDAGPGAAAAGTALVHRLGRRDLPVHEPDQRRAAGHRDRLRRGSRVPDGPAADDRSPREPRGGGDGGRDPGAPGGGLRVRHRQRRAGRPDDRRVPGEDLRPALHAAQSGRELLVH